jgi:hypothetical protein
VHGRDRIRRVSLGCTVLRLATDCGDRPRRGRYLLANADRPIDADKLAERVAAMMAYNSGPSAGTDAHSAAIRREIERGKRGAAPLV